MKKIDKLRSFYQECVRVFRITKKPSREEYKAIMKVAGLGILLIGLIGFIVHAIDYFFKVKGL
jgi:protein transport protein SEC61 subunit gamma-like protein